jgi:MOSC domain-containing protein YiiM
VNVGLPREVEWKGGTVATGIFKAPVAGRMAARVLDLDGDAQADLSVHGGREKAVYVYPAEHYPFWAAELPGSTLAWGAFGENLTTEGLDEDAVHVGDRFRVGSAELMVTQPRLPCYKLGIRFQRADMVKRFLASRRTGFYFSVVREGDVAAGDPIVPLATDPAGVSIAEITRLYLGESDDEETLRRATRLPALPASWQAHFIERLRRHG